MDLVMWSSMSGMSTHLRRCMICRLLTLCESSDGSWKGQWKKMTPRSMLRLEAAKGVGSVNNREWWLVRRRKQILWNCTFAGIEWQYALTAPIRVSVWVFVKVVFYYLCTNAQVAHLMHTHELVGLPTCIHESIVVVPFCTVWATKTSLCSLVLSPIRSIVSQEQPSLTNSLKAHLVSEPLHVLVAPTWLLHLLYAFSFLYLL